MDAGTFWAAMTGAYTFALCFVTGGGLWYAGKQLGEQKKAAEVTNKQLDEQKKIAHGQFLLELDKMFRVHTEVHLRLRPGGAWHNEQGKPASGPAEENSKDWAAVDEYMSLFESIQVLIDKGVIDLETVDRMYGYRLLNIVGNRIIVKEKLESEEKEWWGDFIRLENSIRQKHGWSIR